MSVNKCGGSCNTIYDTYAWVCIPNKVQNIKSKTSKDNHKPISILSNFLKIYERCIYNQMQQYFENILAKY